MQPSVSRRTDVLRQSRFVASPKRLVLLCHLVRQNGRDFFASMRLFRLITALTILLGTGLLCTSGQPAHAATSSADVPHLRVQLVIPSSSIAVGGQSTPA